MNRTCSHVVLQDPPVIAVHAFQSGRKPLAYVDVDGSTMSSEHVDHLLAVADAYQEAARRLRLLQLEQMRAVA